MAEDFNLTIDLVRRVKAGDRAALQPLFSRYHERVWRIARVRLGPTLRQRMDSVDIVQETFIAAMSAVDHYEIREESSLLQWLSVLLENRIRDAADRHEAQRRNPAREQALVVDGRSGPLARDLPAQGPTPSAGAVRSEEVEALEEEIALLPEPERELIVLRNYVGMPWEQIARQLGRPSAAAARMAHAKVLLDLAERLKKRGVAA